MIQRPPEQEISMKGQVFFLVLGLFPLAMLFQFWTRSGTGLNLTLWGFMALFAASLLVAVNYFSFYRQYKPRSALVPAGPLQAVGVAVVLLGLGAFNLMALPHGLSLTLSPGPRIEAGKI